MREVVTQEQARDWIVRQVRGADEDYLLTIIRFFLTDPLPALSPAAAQIHGSQNFMVEADETILASIIESEGEGEGMTE